jgi:hypothetical protein
MANRTFNDKQALEKQIKELYFDAAYVALVAASGVLTLTADITVTAVTGGTTANDATITIAVNAAAANPTDTVLAVVTGTSAAILITITPNDGTNNGATPVPLTTAELRELVATGTVGAKTVTLTDVGSLLDEITATGGGATDLATGGEGDAVVATLAGGVDVAFTLLNSYGISSITQKGVGNYRIYLQDKYYFLKMLDIIVLDSTERDFTFQIEDFDIGATAPYIDIFCLTAGTATTLLDGTRILGSINLKNTTVI